MDKLLTINGRTYKAVPFDLNLICDFEDAGISFNEIDKKMINVVRQYVASSMGVDAKTAGREITEHVTNGGSLDDISDAMSAMMDDSGFFRKKQTGEDSSDTKRTRKKKTESEEVII